MHRCYIEPGGWGAGALVLDREEGHHLSHVLRVREGDVVIVFDGRGRRAQARVGRVGKSLVLELLTGTEQQQPEPLRVTLYQAVIKGNRMDLLIEKAAELGATTIVPLMTERTVVRLAGAQGEERCERWQRIAIGAAKQCGQDWLPEIAPVVGLDGALGRIRGEALCLLGSLQSEAPSARAVVEARRAAGLASAAWIIGPEGDLTEAEQAACVAAGAVAVRLGPRVLRAETAAIAGLSALVFAVG